MANRCGNFSREKISQVLSFKICSLATACKEKSNKSEFANSENTASYLLVHLLDLLQGCQNHLMVLWHTYAVHQVHVDHETEV